ncbi:MAG: EAL domain-containing protein [Selenomonas sp.]|uniref:EAL domain-containing protein n=1 Tax=Selenomonas sp. TaxID=2053611 RepID=UPI0025F5468F|nr:EAL domain-containing protein [Selenomonas sp.]MCR5440053.1 EAL domain-containing protein [Selenomonas sp.]
MNRIDDKLAGWTALERYLSDQVDTAIANRNIMVYYQPIIRTITGKICAFEALARWDDPIHGMITPRVFLAVLEATRQTHKLDVAVVEEVCRMLAGRLAQGYPVLPVSLNLSRIDFLAGDFFDIVETAVNRHQLPRKLLRIEVTENLLAADNRITASLRRFQEAGYSILLDDFGQGNSSLNVLKNHQFEALKIDLRFLAPFSPRAKTIIESVVCMAKKMGIHTLAEGVETKEQVEFLTAIGCEQVQGFYYGRPLPMDGVLNHCEEKGVLLEPIEADGCLNAAGIYAFDTKAPMILYELHNGKLRYLKTTAAFNRAILLLGIDSPMDLAQQKNSEARDCLAAIRLGSMQAIKSGQKVTQQLALSDKLCLLEIVYISQYQQHRIFRCHLTIISRTQLVDSFLRENP